MALLLGAAWNARAQLVAVGPEFQVGPSPTYEGPDVSAAASGNFTVVWKSFYGVSARRFDAAGSPLGAEFVAGTITDDPGTNGRDVGVAAAADGDFVVVWGDAYYPTGYQSDAVGQRFDATGAPVGAPFLVNSYTTSYQENPKIAASAAGDFMVVWGDFKQNPGFTGYDVFGRRFNASGVPQGGDFLVNSTAAGNDGDDGSLEMASNPAGSAVVVWEKQGTGIFARRFDPAGMAQGLDFEVSEPSSSYAQSFPAVAVGKDGEFLVAYRGYPNVPQDGNELFGRMFDASGTPVGGEFQVNTATAGEQGYYHSGPALAADGAGNILIVWSSEGSDGDGYGIVARLFDASGTPTSPEFQVNSVTAYDQLYPEVAALGLGEFVVVWGSGYVKAQRIQVSIEVPLAGRALAVRNVVPDNPARNAGSWTSQDPAIVVGGRGTAGDPRCNADPPGTVKATLRFFSATSGHDSGTLPLPCENWTAIGPDTSSVLLRQGYKYSDRELDQGPCSLVRLLAGRVLSATCFGRGATTDFPYDLVPGTDEGVVHVVLAMGNIRYCSSFDDFGGANGSNGRLFKGRNAPAPASCPPP